jgi:hypothetical protein
VNTIQREQYDVTVDLFIGMGRSPGKCDTPGVTQGVHPGLHHLNLLSHVG